MLEESGEAPKHERQAKAPLSRASTVGSEYLPKQHSCEFENGHHLKNRMLHRYTVPASFVAKNIEGVGF